MRTFLLSALFMVMVSLTAFGGPPSVVLVQYHNLDDLVTVTRGVGQTQTIQLGHLNDLKKINSNAEQLYTLFSGLYTEGYTLQSTAEMGAPAYNTQTVTYVFVRP